MADYSKQSKLNMTAQYLNVNESLQHFLLECPVSNDKRRFFLKQLLIILMFLGIVWISRSCCNYKK